MAILDVIKYESTAAELIYKHPAEDFNTGSQLIVGQSQEAIFYSDGVALDSFGPGRYTLETQNIPLIGGLFKLATGGQSPFHCQVYFINKAEKMAMKWGTDSKVQYLEPQYGFPLSIGASGELSLRVENARRLLLKLVGSGEALGYAQLMGLFRALLMTKVKTHIASIMRQQNISIFQIDEKLETLSQLLQQALQPEFSEYGIGLERFFVTNIARPEGEKEYEKFKELYFRQYADVAEAQLRQQVGVIDEQTQAQKRIIEAQATAQKRSIEGYTYQQERGFDVAVATAQNEAAAQFTNMGIGLAGMAGVSGAVGGMVQDAIHGVRQENAQRAGGSAAYCENCGTALEAGTAFCEECGTQCAPLPGASCVQCGFAFKNAGKFCPKCGAPREES